MMNPGSFDFTRIHDDRYAAERDALAVDRERVVHSSAFRRLQYKTQVFVSRQGDHFRSRMTHTLEVASLARRIADLLGLNANLADVVALSHDLGHAPFGHAGERALNACMREHGEQFEHNDHTLRVIDYLEHPYPEFRGLNLTAAVRACLATHATHYDRPGESLSDVPPLEGQVVARADQLAYTLHDLQDGLYAGLLEPRHFADSDDAGLWRECFTGPAHPDQTDCLRHSRPTIERIQRHLLADLQNAFEQRRRAAGLDDEASLRGHAAPLVEFSDAGQTGLDGLGRVVLNGVYRHWQVARMDDKADRLIRAVFGAYAAAPNLLPTRFARRVGEQGVARVAADYIAGMTDRFCQDEHARLFDARFDV